MEAETHTVPRVLVVDDEPIILRLIQVNLRLEGFDVVGCSSGEDALREASERPPDVVVLDVVLPGIDGFEVCRRLRLAPETAHVPVVMVTAQAQDEDRERGYALGVFEYVTKPFEPPVLIAIVRAALESQAR
ncbi:MAG TPA: response regulator [Actinomycetota bacterium]|nr:response regulator [Actinomycetota bacterium]